MKEDYRDFEDLAKMVAYTFNDDVKEFGFDDFNEMVRCYWWTSNDIKDEVDQILRIGTNGDAYVDEFDRNDVFYKGTSISYRKFNTMFRKYLK